MRPNEWRCYQTVGVICVKRSRGKGKSLRAIWSFLDDILSHNREIPAWNVRISIFLIRLSTNLHESKSHFQLLWTFNGHASLRSSSFQPALVAENDD